MDCKPSAELVHRPAPLLNSIADAAQRLGISRSKLYVLINEGRLGAVAVDGRTLIPEASLVSFVASLPAANIGSKAAA